MKAFAARQLVVTHSLSVAAADRPPAMSGRATPTIVVFSTPINAGMTTAAPTNQGLIAIRPPVCSPCNFSCSDRACCFVASASTDLRQRSEGRILPLERVVDADPF